eukprot:CAMPEP_0179086134 /NCGR_PEP_ID=MMETSP0796-20121207/39051_1 /TAXON_ID=73915 /ORGANISM="Pyrodinium bahamense, Strain pbaha01" /LENGTH=272 /DNA_ID=CAMNT_0020783591 /DNA_START=107 /DNA_END=922 /DNA_ORIENTATION=-
MEVLDLQAPGQYRKRCRSWGVVLSCSDQVMNALTLNATAPVTSVFTNCCVGLLLDLRGVLRKVRVQHTGDPQEVVRAPFGAPAVGTAGDADLLALHVDPEVLTSGEFPAGPVDVLKSVRGVPVDVPLLRLAQAIEPEHGESERDKEATERPEALLLRPRWQDGNREAEHQADEEDQHEACGRDQVHGAQDPPRVRAHNRAVRWLQALVDNPADLLILCLVHALQLLRHLLLYAQASTEVLVLLPTDVGHALRHCFCLQPSEVCSSGGSVDVA